MSKYILINEQPIEELRRDIAELRREITELRQLLFNISGKGSVDHEPPMDTADLMKYLKLDRRTIYTYRKKRGMPSEQKENGRIVFWKSQIDAYFGKNK